MLRKSILLSEIIENQADKSKIAVGGFKNTYVPFNLLNFAEYITVVNGKKKTRFL